jgi:hypothetical protein
MYVRLLTELRTKDNERKREREKDDSLLLKIEADICQANSSKKATLILSQFDSWENFPKFIKLSFDKNGENEKRC